MILSLAFTDATDYSEKISAARFMRIAAFRKICDALHKTFPWLLNSQLFESEYVDLLVWESEKRKGKRGSEYAWKSKSGSSHAITENDRWHFKLTLFHIAVLAVNYQTNHPWLLSFSSFFFFFLRETCRWRDKPSRHDPSGKLVTYFKGKWQMWPWNALNACEVKLNQWVAD